MSRRWNLSGRTGPRPRRAAAAQAHRRRIGSSFCALLLLLTGVSAAAPWRFSHLRTEDGLSHNSVYSLLADREGFIWAGTVDGLNRYDGYEVLTFRHDPLDPISLSSPIVLSLAEDGETLWIGTGEGLDRLDSRRQRVERVALEGHKIQDLLIDPAGALWIGTDRGIYRRTAGDGEIRSPLSSHSDLAGLAVYALAEAPDGTIWAAAVVAGEPARQIVISFRDGEAARPLALEGSWGLVKSLTFDLEGALWITPGHAAVVDRETDTIRRHPSDTADAVVYDTALTRDGSVWLATDQGPCHRAPGEDRATCQPIVPGGNWLDNYARSIAEGRGDTLWIGTYGGLAWLDPHAKPFRRWHHDPADPHSLGANAVSSVVLENDHTLWVATFGAGLDRIDRLTGRVTHFRHDPRDPRSIPNDVVWKVLRDPDGWLWVATNRGIARLNPATGKFTSIHSLPVRVAIWDIAIDSDGRVWGSGDGLYGSEARAGPIRRVDLDPEGASKPFEVHAITILENGSFWAGLGVEGLLVRIDPETAASRSYPLRVNGKPLKSEGIWSIRDGRDGRLWIGHGRGLSRFDPKAERFEHWFESDGLPGSIVYSVEVDERGRAWLGTNRGLVRFDEKSPPGSRFRIYDTSDGIASMEFNRNASYRAPDGEMFFGGVVGMTSFRPGEIHDDPRIPSITLTGIEVLGSARRELFPRELEELVLSHGDSPVTFEFASLTFTNVSRNRYRYRLEGFDEGWIEAGNRRYARYTNVPAGRYVLRVIGSNQDGVWNETGVSLPVIVLPPFWETWWFRSFLLIMTGSLLYAGHRFRMTKAIEVERLRLRIASDLHDDLSSELSGMSMMADLIRRGEALSPDGAGRLDELRRKALEMADSMRDTAWGIHPEHDTAGAMIRRMRSTAEMLLSDIPFTFDVQGIDADAALPMSERRNLHLILKELLHNVVRHASASAVHIILERIATDDMRLTVADDGRGFDPSATGDGDGLRNIRRRASRIGASFEITSADGGGTRARVQLPGRS